MDDTPRLKANLRRKRLIGLGIALLACWALYQWYYIPGACNSYSKPVWVYFKPHRYAGINPHSPSLVLLKIPSSYMETNRTPYHWFGGHVEFVNLDLTREDMSPHCLRKQPYMRKGNGTALHYYPPDNSEEYKDGFDLQYLRISLNGAGKPIPAEVELENTHHTEFGLTRFIAKPGTLAEGTEFFFSQAISPEQQRISCTKNHQGALALCTGVILHKDIEILYSFHYSQLSGWHEISGKVINFIDAATIIRL